MLDVVAYGNIRARGQAFVAFKDEESATKAIKELQHFVLYDKPLVLQYARSKSDVHAKLDGDYDNHHSARLEEKGWLICKNFIFYSMFLSNLLCIHTAKRPPLSAPVGQPQRMPMPGNLMISL